jgi:hypothetical protein
MVSGFSHPYQTYRQIDRGRFAKQSKKGIDGHDKYNDEYLNLLPPRIEFKVKPAIEYGLSPHK